MAIAKYLSLNLNNFFQIFLFRTFTYTVNVSLVNFKKKLKKAFGDDMFLSLKLKKEMDKSFDFAISKYMPTRRSIERGIGHIKGTFTDYNDYATVTIQVRPNIIWFVILLFLLSLILYNIFLLFFYKIDFATTLFKIVAFVFAIILDYVMARGFSNNIKDNFDDFILETKNH